MSNVEVMKQAIINELNSVDETYPLTEIDAACFRTVINICSNALEAGRTPKFEKILEDAAKAYAEFVLGGVE